MTDVSELQHAAIRTRVWLGGRFLSRRDPVPIQITSKRFESRVRTSNLAMRIDRPFTLAGMPNIRNRREFVLPWPDIREPEQLEHLDTLAQIGQPVELGLWKQEYDVFDGDATNDTFYLQRRQILPVVTPPTEFADYATRVTVYDKPYTDPTATGTPLTVVQKTSSTIDTSDPSAGEVWIESDGEQVGNLWVSKMRIASDSIPPDEFDCLVAVYLPLYTVTIEEEAPRSYAQSLMEPRAFRLSEFG